MWASPLTWVTQSLILLTPLDSEESLVPSLPQLPSNVCTASAPLLQIISLSLFQNSGNSQTGRVNIDLRLTHVYFLISNTVSKKQEKLWIKLTFTLLANKGPVPAGMGSSHGAGKGKDGKTDFTQGNAEELNLLPLGSCVRLSESFKSSFVHVATNGMFPILSTCVFRPCGLICRSLSLPTTRVNGFSNLRNWSTVLHNARHY